jgi:hypothetical protein
MRRNRGFRTDRVADRAGRTWSAITSLPAWLAIAVLLGCTNVQVVEPYDGALLPRPDRILVYEFSHSLDRVELNPQISPGAPPRTATSLEAQKHEVGRRVASVLAEHLVKELRSMGLHVEPGPAASPTSGNLYTIEGQFLSIDMGDLTQRAETGIGRTEVKTRIQLYHHQRSGKRLIETLDVNAKGAGARTTGMDVEAEAAHTAEKVAEKLREFFARQGWLST